VIVHCNYEETSALRSGARSFLGVDVGGTGRVLAPTEDRVAVESLLPALTGDFSVATLEELRAAKRGVEAIVAHLREEMNVAVTVTHPADEQAVAAYFDYAHALSVSHRFREVEQEMEALIEVVTGEDPTEEHVAAFHFPD